MEKYFKGKLPLKVDLFDLPAKINLNGYYISQKGKIIDKSIISQLNS